MQTFYFSLFTFHFSLNKLFTLHFSTSFGPCLSRLIQFFCHSGRWASYLLNDCLKFDRNVIVDHVFSIINSSFWKSILEGRFRRYWKFELFFADVLSLLGITFQVFPPIKKDLSTDSTDFHGLGECFNDYRLPAEIWAFFPFRSNLPGFLPTWKVFFYYDEMPICGFYTSFGQCLSHLTPFFCHSGRWASYLLNDGLKFDRNVIVDHVFSIINSSFWKSILDGRFRRYWKFELFFADVTAAGHVFATTCLSIATLRPAGHRRQLNYSFSFATAGNLLLLTRLRI